MKKVVYKGDIEVIIPSLGILVKQGDVIDVPDDFLNGQFEDVKEKKEVKEENK